MWCHYCDKNRHNTTDCRLLPNINSRKRARLALKPKLDPERCLRPSFYLEEINAIKRQLKPEKAASSRKRKEEG
jgi:hypothetical protein